MAREGCSRTLSRRRGVRAGEDGLGCAVYGAVSRLFRLAEGDQVVSDDTPCFSSVCTMSRSAWLNVRDLPWPRESGRGGYVFDLCILVNLPLQALEDPGLDHAICRPCHDGAERPGLRGGEVMSNVGGVASRSLEANAVASNANTN